MKSVISKLYNGEIFTAETATVFDRAYEEMNGPQMCCLWSSELIPPDTVRQYLDGQGLCIR
ncbi:hypothetical protein [Acutalibacter muris]|uniref:hypothetical protein n=1 Tax=Acutalibacter muris TaxID=1796620 RepID=UPI001C3EE18B|nr:hypothetical protein [Acutalibacter muris]